MQTWCGAWCCIRYVECVGQPYRCCSPRTESAAFTRTHKFWKEVRVVLGTGSDAIESTQTLIIQILGFVRFKLLFYYKMRETSPTRDDVTQSNARIDTLHA